MPFRSPILPLRHRDPSGAWTLYMERYSISSIHPTTTGTRIPHTSNPHPRITRPTTLLLFFGPHASPIAGGAGKGSQRRTPSTIESEPSLLSSKTCFAYHFEPKAMKCNSIGRGVFSFLHERPSYYHWRIPRQEKSARKSFTAIFQIYPKNCY